jgi:hypothetical protein
MIFVVASWASMLLALALAWLWLQGQPSPGQVHDVAHAESLARATRTTVRSVALLAAMSTALLLLHFVLPAREARTDAAWAPRGSVDPRNSTVAL